MPGAQYSSTTFTNYFNDFLFSSYTCNMDQIGKYIYILIIAIANYFLNLILTLKEKDLLSPSTLNG